MRMHTQPVLKCPRSATATYLSRRGVQTAAGHPHRRTTVALSIPSAASRSSIGHGVGHLLRHGTGPGVRDLIRHGIGLVSIFVASSFLNLVLTSNLHSNFTKPVSCVARLTTNLPMHAQSAG